MATINSVILGAAGEHYVMAELLRRGLIAAKAPEGVPNFDIVITDIDGERLAAIQVKTRRDYQGGDKGWHMKAKHDQFVAEQMFYVFVDVGRDDDSAVSYFVMPSHAVAEACKVSHQIWLQTPGVNGRTHQDSDVRRLLPKYHRNDRMRLTAAQESFMDSHGEGWMEQYRNAWHQIGNKL
jgi:hypothetical protein